MFLLSSSLIFRGDRAHSFGRLQIDAESAGLVSRISGINLAGMGGDAIASGDQIVARYPIMGICSRFKKDIRKDTTERQCGKR
jgi:hypothetical protein